MKDREARKISDAEILEQSQAIVSQVLRGNGIISFKSDTLNVGKKLKEENTEIVEAFLYAFDNGLEAAPTCELTSDSVHCYHGLNVDGKAIVIYTGFLKKDIVRSMN